MANSELSSKRLDDINTHLVDQSRRIDDVNKRIDDMHSDLVNRLDANNERIDRFFLTAATKEEQAGIDARLFQLEQGLEGVRQRLAGKPSGVSFFALGSFKCRMVVISEFI